MHRQMFDTLVAPKTVASRRSTASKISFVVPVTAAGSPQEYLQDLLPGTLVLAEGRIHHADRGHPLLLKERMGDLGLT